MGLFSVITVRVSSERSRRAILQTPCRDQTETVVQGETGKTVSFTLLFLSFYLAGQSEDKLHGFKYSLVYIVAGRRVIGYDNGEGKGDHRHYGDREERYNFVSLRQLAEDFMTDVENYRRSGQ